MCCCGCQIKDLYKESVERIRDSNKWDLVRPAFTCDLWRSRTTREYFTLTMHYIDVKRGEAGTQWALRKRILGSIAVRALHVDHEGDKGGYLSAASSRLGFLCSGHVHVSLCSYFLELLPHNVFFFALCQRSLAWQGRSSRSTTSWVGCQRLCPTLAAMSGGPWLGK